jgi:mitochondrial pyruvate carrier 1
MTGALTVYSATFMRYALAVSPKNYLLFGCHFINCSSQLVQGYRYMQYWNYGGREVALKAKEAAAKAEQTVKSATK